MSRSFSTKNTAPPLTADDWRQALRALRAVADQPVAPATPPPLIVPVDLLPLAEYAQAMGWLDDPIPHEEGTQD